MNLFKQAAALRRKNKRLTVPQSVKLAARQNRAKKSVRKKGKVGAVKFIEKGKTRKTKAAKVYRVDRSNKGQFRGAKRIAGIYSDVRKPVKSVLAEARRAVLDEIGKLEAKKFATKLKRDKAKILKMIVEKRKIYRKLN